MDIKYDNLPAEAVTVLQSEAVQAAIKAAHEAAVAASEAPLKQSKDAILGEKLELARKLAEIEALGGLAALQELPKTKEAVKTKSEQETAYAEQVKALQTELNGIKAREVNGLLQAKLHKEIRDADGVPELLETHLRSRIKHEQDDAGALKVTVLDRNGIPMIVDGKDASLKDLLTEFKANTTLARAFNAPALNGGGTKTTVSTSAVNPFSPATKNLTEQGRLLKTDKPAAIRLANEAGVKVPGLNA